MSNLNESFTELMRRACGDRSIAVFSSESGIALSSMYKYCSGDFKRKLTKKTASKIAAGSADQTITPELIIQKSAEFIALSDGPKGIREQRKGNEDELKAQEIIIRQLSVDGAYVRVLDQNDKVKRTETADFALAVIYNGEESLRVYEVKHISHHLSLRRSLTESVGRAVLNGLYNKTHYYIVILSDEVSIEEISNICSNSSSLPISIILISEGIIKGTISLEKDNH